MACSSSEWACLYACMPCLCAWENLAVHTQSVDYKYSVNKLRRKRRFVDRLSTTAIDVLDFLHSQSSLHIVILAMHLRLLDAFYVCVFVCRQPDNKTISQKTTTLKTVNMHAHIRTKHRKLESKTPRTSRLFAFARIFGGPIASAVLNWGGSYCGGHARSASCDVPHHHIKKPLKTDSDGSTSRRLSGVRAFRQRVVWRTSARRCVCIAWLNRARAAQRTPAHLYNFAHTRMCDTKLR